MMMCLNASGVAPLHISDDDAEAEDFLDANMSEAAGAGLPPNLDPHGRCSVDMATEYLNHHLSLYPAPDNMYGATATVTGHKQPSLTITHDLCRMLFVMQMHSSFVTIQNLIYRYYNYVGIIVSISHNFSYYRYIYIYNVYNN